MLLGERGSRRASTTTAAAITSPRVCRPPRRPPPRGRSRRQRPGRQKAAADPTEKTTRARLTGEETVRVRSAGERRRRKRESSWERRRAERGVGSQVTWNETCERQIFFSSHRAPVHKHYRTHWRGLHSTWRLHAAPPIAAPGASPLVVADGSTAQQNFRWLPACN